jgi:hypothetical protein
MEGSHGWRRSGTRVCGQAATGGREERLAAAAAAAGGGEDAGGSGLDNVGGKKRGWI